MPFIAFLVTLGIFFVLLVTATVRAHSRIALGRTAAELSGTSPPADHGLALALRVAVSLVTTAAAVALAYVLNPALTLRGSAAYGLVWAFATLGPTFALVLCAAMSFFFVQRGRWSWLLLPVPILAASVDGWLSMHLALPPGTLLCVAAFVVVLGVLTSVQTGQDAPGNWWVWNQNLKGPRRR